MIASSKIKLEQLYYLLLMFSMSFAAEFLPYTIIYFVILLLLLKLIKPDWKGYLIYPLMIIFLYLIRTSFERFFIPEATVSLLIGLCAIRMLHFYPKKIPKSDYLLGFLFLAGLSLFNSSLGFMLYLVLSSLLVFTLLADIKWNELRLAVSIKALLKYFLLVAPLTFALFFFFPRFRSFFPSANSTLKGEVGYSQEVNNSQTANLNLSDKTAFYVEMPRRENVQLYWRGRVLNFTDGYNWKSTINYALASNLQFSGEKISYKIKYQQHFKGDLILLDVPYQVERSQLRVYSQKGHQSFHSYVKNKKNLVEASSYNTPPSYELSKRQKKLYLQKPSFTPKMLKELIQSLDKSNNETLIKSFKSYLQKNNFAYTLSPGPMPTMRNFLQNKKGYCTHYAALMALVFRHLDIPSRIVTGFQGGIYNSIGAHYTVRSSDAHAWVEYWHNKKWLRVDPTQFVAPLRISQGQILSDSSNVTAQSSSYWTRWSNTLKQYYDNINYRVSLFLDNYDRNYQNLLANKLKMNLKIFYLLGFLLLVPIFYIIKYNLKPKLSLKPIDLLFNKFQKKLAKNNINLDKIQNIQSIRKDIEKLPSTKARLALEILELYQSTKYGRKNHYKELADKIKHFH